MQEITVRDVYNKLHKEAKELFLHHKYTEDRANRAATIYAVEHAWFEFNDKGIDDDIT